MESIISRPCREVTPSWAIEGRIARARRLSPDQVEAALAFLARYDGDIFDAVIEAGETWNDGTAGGIPLGASR